MSTVHEQDESTRKIILPESYSYNNANGPLPSTPHRPKEELILQPTTVVEKRVSISENDTRFGLLDNEDEERLLGDSQRRPSADERLRRDAGSDKPSEMGARHVSTAPTLRTTSLPKGAASQTVTILPHATSVANVNIPRHSGNSPARVPLTPNELRKPKKEVSDYYKKQNELLENFKNDSEQIHVFQKTRTRQRLQSSTSTDTDLIKEDMEPSKRNSVSKESKDRRLSNDLSSSLDTAVAPLLKNTDGESDVEIGQPGRVPPNLLEETENISVRERIPSETSSDRAKHEAAQDAAKASGKAAARLAHATLVVNVTLMLAKAVASYLSGSLSILSSLVDSCVDITSGLVISISTRMIKKRDPYLYPRGRTRLEPLSLIVISVVMGVASVQLIFGAITRIHAAYQFHVNAVGEQPELDVSITTVCIMVATVLVKFTLFMICQKYKHDPSIEVLAMDHRNDCLSNTVALTCAWLGTLFWYYLDPIGAILVSIYILYTWVSTGWEHLSKLSGRSAKPEFINRIIKVCIDHDPRISHLDTVYVYHFGTKFLVEVHIVLDKNMPLKVAHDISETLQINIESLPEVERAFVHTDYEYEHQPEDEHKIV